MALIVFYLIILIVGIIAAWKKTRLKKDQQQLSVTLMVAHKDVNVILGVFTMTAVIVGGGYINGTAEIIFTSGIIWAQAPVGYCISNLLARTIFAKPMRERNTLPCWTHFNKSTKAAL